MAGYHRLFGDGQLLPDGRHCLFSLSKNTRYVIALHLNV
jgi:hypothetical protein